MLSDNYKREFTYFSNGDGAMNENDMNKVSRYDIWKNYLIFNNEDDTNLASSSGNGGQLVLDDIESTGSSFSDPNSNDSIELDETRDKNINYTLPYMVPINKHKRLNIGPSCFHSGCICGHNIEYRDMVYETRKHRNIKVLGVTIRPKTPAINIGLRKL